MPFLQGKIIARQVNKIQIAFQTTLKCEQNATPCAHTPHAWRLFPPKMGWFDFNSAAQVGDSVIVSVSNSAYHKLLLRLYGLPLLALWSGAGLGSMWGTAWSVLAGISLFAAAWGLNFIWAVPTVYINRMNIG